MAKLAGVDGCPKGWFVVTEDSDQGELHYFIAPDFQELTGRLTNYHVIAVDIPIGLPDRGARDCDRLARQLLGPKRGSSVFPAPPRPCLGATTHREASDRRKALEYKGMSVQAFGILKKVGEVDTVMRGSAQVRRCVYEVHPEVSFMALNGGQVMLNKKKGAPGRNERRGHLRKIFSEPELVAARQNFLVKEVGHDDLYDAFVALWTARRIQSGIAERIPAAPTRDSHGLDMAIWY